MDSLPTCCTSVQKCCFRALLIFLREFWFLNTEMWETSNTLGSHQFGEYSGTQMFPFQIQNWHQFEGEPEMGMTTQHTHIQRYAPPTVTSNNQHTVHEHSINTWHGLTYAYVHYLTPILQPHTHNNVHIQHQHMHDCI